MRVAHTAAELFEHAELFEAAPERGDKRTKRAVVMTMGALHEGHLALVRAAREMADEVVVTVFVNPLQFNDQGDLERYPRNLDADCALLEPLGVDVVFAPSVDEMYPGGEPFVRVNAGAFNDVFEGAFRPGHFDGVLTVVLKLLNLTRPAVALFGQKDAQQFIAIKAMCMDLSVPVEIAAIPTVRDEDGLALSSRNVFLSADERADALALSRALRESGQVLDEGGSLALALAVGRAALAEVPGVAVDYLAALHPATAQPVADDYRGDVTIAVAARVGETRLIDNIAARVGLRNGVTDSTAPEPTAPEPTAHGGRFVTFATMQRPMMISKIHRATVTQADLHYVGSITIDTTLMEAADLIPGQQVDVVDVTNGSRLTTYAIPGEADSGVICINGAAAHLVHDGDLVIIIGYGLIGDGEARQFEPHVVFVDADNRIVDIGSDPGQVPANWGLETSALANRDFRQGE